MVLALRPLATSCCVEHLLCDLRATAASAEIHNGASLEQHLMASVPNVSAVKRFLLNVPCFVEHFAESSEVVVGKGKMEALAKPVGARKVTCVRCYEKWRSRHQMTPSSARQLPAQYCCYALG